MLQLSEACVAVQHSDIHDFIDKINVVVNPPFSREQILRMEKDCRVRIYKWDGHKLDGPKFLPNGAQLLPIAQPTSVLYRTLAVARPDYRISQVEIARDLIFDNDDDKTWATLLLRCHSLKSNQKGKIRFYKGVTTYTGPRSTANNFVTYADRNSKFSGEVHCLHIEWRLRRYALADLGIKTFDDIQRLDLKQFWRERRVFLYTIDPNKLGRQHNNWWYGTHRRRPWIEQCGQGRIEYHRDLRTGHQIMRALGSISNVVSFYRKHFKVRSCLIPINVEQLLPRNRGPTHCYDYLTIWPVLPFPMLIQKVDMGSRPEITELRGADVELNANAGVVDRGASPCW